MSAKRSIMAAKKSGAFSKKRPAAAVEKPAAAAPKLAPCAKCEKPVDAEMQFCSGCKNVICENCGEAPWGPHRLRDHTQPCRKCGERANEPGADLCEDCQ